MPNKWNSNIANVKSKVRDKGLTIKQFAEALGVNFSTAQYKLSGKSSFTVDEAARAANILDQSPLIFFENQIDKLSN